LPVRSTGSISPLGEGQGQSLHSFPKADDIFPLGEGLGQLQGADPRKTFFNKLHTYYTMKTAIMQAFSEVPQTCCISSPSPFVQIDERNRFQHVNSAQITKYFKKLSKTY